MNVYMGPVLPPDYSPDGDPPDGELLEPEFPELWCEHAPDDGIECEFVFRLEDIEAAEAAEVAA